MRSLIAASAAALMLTGCSSSPLADDGRDARVGEIFVAYGPAEGHAATLNLPVNRYEFSVSEPKDRASEELTLDDAGVSAEAADGMAFIALSFSREAVPGDVWMLDSDEEREKPTVWLDVDGKKFDLDIEDARSWILAVPERPDEVRLVAEVSGREIAVDPYDQIGRQSAGDVYEGRAPRFSEAPCPVPKQIKVTERVDFSGAECRVEFVDPVPWANLGDLEPWPASGKRYLVVRASIEKYVHFIGRDGSDWNQKELTLHQPEFSLDGQKPLVVLDWDRQPVASTDESDGRWLVFEVDADADSATLTLSRRFDAVGEDDSSVEHTVKRKVELSMR